MREGSSLPDKHCTARILRRSALVAALITVLSACDNSDVKTTVPSDSATATTTQKKVLSDADLAQLAKQSKGKALALLDASELQLDGAAALVLTFSVPLDPKQKFADRVHLVDTENGKIDGAWELADNLRELRLRHLEPKRKLLLTVDPELTALNGATLGKEAQQKIATKDIQPSVGFASRGSLLPGTLVAPEQESSQGIWRHEWLDDEGKRVAPECHGAVEKLLALWPLPLEPWLPEAEKRANRIPVASKVCPPPVETLSAPLVLIGLSDGSILRRPPGKTDIDLRLTTQGGEGQRWWFLNGELVSQEASLFYRFTKIGRYQLTVMDGGGQIASVDFQVE